MIGPYKLLQEIGHGGFGIVYMAEQQEPVRRQVALKIIKPGMDTRASQYQRASTQRAYPQRARLNRNEGAGQRPWQALRHC
jgi:serine/threonine protein kinase